MNRYLHQQVTNFHDHRVLLTIHITCFKKYSSFKTARTKDGFSLQGSLKFLQGSSDTLIAYSDILWYLPRFLQLSWRKPVQYLRSFSRDPRHLILNHGFPIIRLSRPEEIAYRLSWAETLAHRTPLRMGNNIIRTCDLLIRKTERNPYSNNFIVLRSKVLHHQL